ncbi:signal peptidase I [Candidatus Enterococcus clewellii]|uniref:signal peptidase I n=1 Tax=Candidatus Enterococcus clewellii TaxID=1834193 RepID=UPI003BB06BB0
MYLISLFTFTIQQMEGYMMAPTVADGEILFVNKRRAIRRFDLVLIKDEGDSSLSVRRVIGLPTERLFYKNDELFVNDIYQVERFLEKKLYESHQMGMILTPDFTLSQVIGETVIPKEEYFVMGDNRTYAQDSRDYGTVKKTQIIGVIKMRLFPFHKLSGL